jgi:hypothetical protein
LVRHVVWLQETFSVKDLLHGRFERVELNTTRAALLDSDPDVQFVLYVQAPSP